jgi:hypothetical protein
MSIGTPYGSELPTHARSEQAQGDNAQGHHAPPEPEGGCAFILDPGTLDRDTLDPDTLDRDRGAAAGQRSCGAPRRVGSVYCHEHHALCYLPFRSFAEWRKLREIDALATAVGGRSGRPARQPPPRFMRRMNQISRAALRPKCSRNVPLEGADREVNRGETR